MAVEGPLRGEEWPFAEEGQQACGSPGSKSSNLPLSRAPRESQLRLWAAVAASNGTPPVWPSGAQFGLSIGEFLPEVSKK